jgi:hypothetical protein
MSCPSGEKPSFVPIQNRENYISIFKRQERERKTKRF